MTTFLDRRGRRIQLETIELLAKRGPSTAEQVAGSLGGIPDSVGRRLRLYARRGWLGRRYTTGGVLFFVRQRGAQRARWLRETAGRKASERTS